jgi:hypothetical protein
LLRASNRPSWLQVRLLCFVFLLDGLPPVLFDFREHQGAIVEYVDIQDAGKAALALEGKEITAGRPLHIGTVREMMNSHIPRPLFRAPGCCGRLIGPVGCRFGFFVLFSCLTDCQPSAANPASDKMDTTPDGESKPKKSNDDFRAMLHQKRPE